MMIFHGCQINNVWKNNSLILKSARSALCEYGITGFDNTCTNLDHVIDGESCPHRSSGGQSIRQGQMSETYIQNQ